MIFPLFIQSKGNSPSCCSTQCSVNGSPRSTPQSSSFPSHSSLLPPLYSHSNGQVSTPSWITSFCSIPSRILLNGLTPLKNCSSISFPPFSSFNSLLYFSTFPSPDLWILRSTCKITCQLCLSKNQKDCSTLKPMLLELSLPLLSYSSYCYHQHSSLGLCV